jgi:hypothetical protein
MAKLLATKQLGAWRHSSLDIARTKAVEKMTLDTLLGCYGEEIQAVLGHLASLK